jgi:hypothetical protein
MNPERNLVGCQQPGAESGAVDDEPDRLNRLIASLTPAELARLLERLRDRH